MSRILSAFSNIGKKRPLTPKERVRAIVETASANQWRADKETDDELHYASVTGTTPGLCIFANGKFTLAPETGLRYFGSTRGHFAFDDAPEVLETLDAKGLDGPALRAAVRDLLVRWLADWRFFNEATDKRSARWIFTSDAAVPPTIALGEIALTNMPDACQLNVERYTEVSDEDRANREKPMPGKFKICFSLVDNPT